MKIKKFNENYELDESNDIGEEYAKLVISHYIDNLNDGKTLQDSFDYYCKDDLEEELRMIVFSEIRSFMNKFSDDVRMLDHTDDDYLKRDAGKYNV